MADKILHKVNSLGLDMDLCRGQGYDGAGNMAGKCSGAATLIQKDHPKALYVHCRAHVLNLCVAFACTIHLVRNMMCHVKAVSQFFNMHPKRFEVLNERITTLLPNARHSHLLDVCRTRWLARIDGLDVFIEVFEAVVSALEAIKLNISGKWSSDSIRDASGLFFGIVSFEFIISLVIVSRLLEVTRPLTKQLQSPHIDVLSAVEKINLLYSMFMRMRNEITELHQEWFDEAVELAKKVSTLPSKPRTAQKQLHRQNTPSDSPSEYYRRVISVPFLDHMTSQIQTRFSAQSLTLLNASYALPNNILFTRDWKVKFQDLLSLYKDDLPEPRYLSLELKTWENKWAMHKGPMPKSLATLLPLIDRQTFPNIFTVLKIAATTPVTSCSCERSISVLRRLKTYLRSTMAQDRMNGLAMLNVHREIPLDTNVVIDRFALEHPRRMKLRDILNSDPVP